MRVFSSPAQAFREVERDLWEMGINVHPQTMQDRDVRDDPDFVTKELQGYGFKITGHEWSEDMEARALQAIMPHNEINRLISYIEQEFKDRTSVQATNPGLSWQHRPEVWSPFLHGQHFAYTYSERMIPQLFGLIHELHHNPESRQGVITMHSNIAQVETQVNQFGVHQVELSADVKNRGGGGRIPCSMYYQILIRRNALDLIYTMRSCDFLTHFAVDVCLALRLQEWFRKQLKLNSVGEFTYFTGSLHAYYKDMKDRGIF